ncbi:MAG TPA: prenyltransferase/squalene oxidase repeat-containing protein [Fimbriiglobus sp.]|jgi:geranylgeranyl transferase type-2 subunit beta
MTPEPYLTRLTIRLLDGIEMLPSELREKHAAYVKAKQLPDGGFPGREGGSDLYYTGFALRSLAVLQALSPEICEPCGRFLQSRLASSTGVVDFFSLLVSCYLVPLGGGPDVLAVAPADWKDRVAAILESFRTPDGGYGKVPGVKSGSTYTSFLVTLALQLLDRPTPQPDKLIAFIKSRRREDGGYVEIAPMKRSGTNPTAAGVGVLQMLNALDDAKENVSVFLTGLPSKFEGGLRANDRIPVADLLSTFTGAWTLDQLGAFGRLNSTAIREYAESCEHGPGGFKGGLWDEVPDVEYTFYGLGVLALIAMHDENPTAE